MRKLTVRFLVVLLVVVMTAGVGSKAFAATYTTYTVQPGDSLWKIANKFSTTVNYLKQLNNHWTSYIEIGQVLKVPGGSTSKSWVYIVQPGDTLWKIYLKTGVQYTTIKQVNNLSSNEIWPGQRLTIPGSSATPTPAPAPVITPGISYTQADLDMMARIIYAESRGESYLGQLAVGAVLINRIKSPDFPNTLYGVIHQELAFESVADGQYGLSPDASAYRAALAAFKGEDPTNGALFFWNPDRVTNPNNWVWTRPITMRIGNHVFAK